MNKKHTEQPEINEGLNAFRKIREMVENGELPDLTPEEIEEEIRLVRSEKSIANQ